MNPTVLKLALGVGLVVIALGAALWYLWRIWRKARRASSKFGFTAHRHSLTDPVHGHAPAKRDGAFIKTEKFIAKRGQRIADVLMDYAAVKGLKMGVYVARPQPDSCVWWIGDKYPSAPKTVLAAVHVGLGSANVFRSKVVLLAKASEAEALSRALARAAKPRSRPNLTDGWSMPIGFPGFPLRPGSPIEIVELRAPSTGNAAE